MNRDELRSRIRELEAQECWMLLERRQVGRVGFREGHDQVILPVNYVVDGPSVVIRTGFTSLLDALGPGATVAFEVDDMISYAETGWSVVLKGYAAEVTDPVGRADVTELDLHPWAGGEREHWIRFVPWSVTGRAINRMPNRDDQPVPYMPAD